MREGDVVSTTPSCFVCQEPQTMKAMRSEYL